MTGFPEDFQAAGPVSAALAESDVALEGYCERWQEAAEIQAEIEAERDAPEWDDAESAAYHARVEAGLEPEAGQ